MEFVLVLQQNPVSVIGKDGACSAKLSAMGGEIVLSTSLYLIIKQSNKFNLHCRYFFDFRIYVLFVCFYALYSRPKQVKDVAHQDEVVRVLTNTLETANVCNFC